MIMAIWLRDNLVNRCVYSHSYNHDMANMKTNFRFIKCVMIAAIQWSGWQLGYSLCFSTHTKHDMAKMKMNFRFIPYIMIVAIRTLNMTLVSPSALSEQNSNSTSSDLDHKNSNNLSMYLRAVIRTFSMHAYVYEDPTTLAGRILIGLSSINWTSWRVEGSRQLLWNPYKLHVNIFVSIGWADQATTASRSCLADPIMSTQEHFAIVLRGFREFLVEKAIRQLSAPKPDQFHQVMGWQLRLDSRDELSGKQQDTEQKNQRKKWKTKSQSNWLETNLHPHPPNKCRGGMSVSFDSWRDGARQRKGGGKRGDIEVISQRE